MLQKESVWQPKSVSAILDSFEFAGESLSVIEGSFCPDSCRSLSGLELIQLAILICSCAIFPQMFTNPSDAKKLHSSKSLRDQMIQIANCKLRFYRGFHNTLAKKSLNEPANRCILKSRIPIQSCWLSKQQRQVKVSPNF